MSFSKAVGRWLGAAEVYDGGGQFAGNAVDQRNVQDLGEGAVQIDLSFTGPFKFAGHYRLEDKGPHRLYRGPMNVGRGDVLGENAVDAKGYWPPVGLSQRLLLMILDDGDTQLSLAHMSRGEQLMYTVVGEYYRQKDGEALHPAFLSGTAYDLAGDPAGGRGEVLLHRSGTWRGTLLHVGPTNEIVGRAPYEERMSAEGDRLSLALQGIPGVEAATMANLRTNGLQAWSDLGGVVGSWNLAGGRAGAGTLHFVNEDLRLWRREICTHDGARKGVVHELFRGPERLGAQVGVLAFEAP